MENDPEENNKLWQEETKAAMPVPNPEVLKEKDVLRQKLLAWTEACGDKGEET